MTFALRPYQQDTIARVRAALQRQRRVLLQLPTGGGKTLIGSYMTGGARERGLSTWFLVHRDFLVSQTVAAFERLGIPAGIIAAGVRPSPWEQVQVVSIQTLARRLERYTPPSFMIVDEAHHSASATWARIMAWHTGRVVGLSATPARLDGRGLDDFFGELVQGPSVRSLMDEGFLSRYRAYAPTKPDLTGVRTMAGDYAQGQLAAVMDQGEIIGDMVGHYRRLADGKRAIYFAVSVRHSEHIAATFNRAGVAARHLDAGSSTVERNQAASDLAEGKTRILVNVDLFGEGYDLAAQAGREVSIECIGLARPTQSLTLHLQQLGRALRPKSEPAIILDHAGNLARHGLPDQAREWTLKGRDRKSRASDSGPPVRQCPMCYAVHEPALECPYCGHVYVVEGREPDEISGVLAEVDLHAVEAARHMDFVARKIEERACKTLADWQRLGQKRGFKYGWALYRWEASRRKPRGGVDSRPELRRTM